MKFHVWGMSGTLVTEKEESHDFATRRLSHWLDAIDASCSRFRDDSELSRLNARGEAIMSATFERALVTAVESWHATQGLCDPTVLPALLALDTTATLPTSYADKNSRAARVRRALGRLRSVSTRRPTLCRSRRVASSTWAQARRLWQLISSPTTSPSAVECSSRLAEMWRCVVADRTERGRLALATIWSFRATSPA